jgi:hypothetical protein
MLLVSHPGYQQRIGLFAEPNIDTIFEPATFVREPTPVNTVHTGQSGDAKCH